HGLCSPWFLPLLPDSSTSDTHASCVLVACKNSTHPYPSYTLLHGIYHTQDKFEELETTELASLYVRIL
ncbi:hypothetical protein A2U01_0087087, partial [Trifolium medium]|nr:hypothetical protein [Trifolium medium]